MKPFRIIVPCKRVIDYAVKVRVKPDGSGVEKLNVKHSMNPFDEIALEESIRLKEMFPQRIKEIIALSIGPKQCQETLRSALAIGADSAIHVEVDDELKCGPIIVSKILQKIVGKEHNIDLVFLGKQAIDDDCGQTGQLLAGLLNWPQATFASSLSLMEDKIGVAREVDNGIEKIQCKLPAIITSDLRLNEPRYASLQNIMKSKSKPMKKETLESLGINAKPSLTVSKTFEPKKRQSGLKVETVDDLIKKIESL